MKSVLYKLYKLRGIFDPLPSPHHPRNYVRCRWHLSNMRIVAAHSHGEQSGRIAEHRALLRQTSIGRHVVVGECVTVAIEIGCMDDSGVVLFRF